MMNMPLQIECTLFFQENSYNFETLDQIASHLGKHPEEIKLTVEYLTSLSILETTGEGEVASYRYVQPDCNRIHQEL